MAWSVEGELLSLTRCTSLHEALLSSGMISRQEVDPTSKRPIISVVADWHRGGAETYILVFQVDTGMAKRQFVIKSCVAWGLEPLSVIFESWFERRSILSEAQVGTPQLFGRDDSTLVEEFIPYRFLDLIEQSVDSSNLLFAAGWTAGVMARCGFLSFDLTDWRSRGDDVVLIDFGQDLGSARVAESSHASLANISELISNLEAVTDRRLMPDEIRAISRGHASAVDIA